MSAVIEIAPELRDEIARAIHERAIKFPNSICGDVRPERFDAVVAGVCGLIDLDFPDRDAALWAAMGKYKNHHGSDFIRRRNPHTEHFSHYRKYPHD